MPLGDSEVKDQELELAVQLIEQAASDIFRPEDYNDEVRERVLALIQQKVDGEEITVAATEEPQTQIIDLMAALKASLTAGKGEGEAERKPAKPVANKAKPKTGQKRTGPAKRKKVS